MRYKPRIDIHVPHVELCETKTLIKCIMQRRRFGTRRDIL